MKIALFSTFIPFIDGGYRNIVNWLGRTLAAKGHAVETVFIPQADDPDSLIKQMMALRLTRLDAADRVITFRPQSHLIQHDDKVAWFIHHVRPFYDLWSSNMRGFPVNEQTSSVRAALHEIDKRSLEESKAIYTNSRVVQERLQTFNGVSSEVLYPPLINPERFLNNGLNDEVVYLSRIEPHKRQDLLVEAMGLTSNPVKLRIVGQSHSARYTHELVRQISRLGLEDRVHLEDRWVSEHEKIDILSRCLAVAYLPLDEDSYGYPSLEASYSSKPVLTTTDSGGVLELIADGINGLVVEPNPDDMAQALDRLWENKDWTQALGRGARDRLEEFDISWETVIRKLLA